MRLPHLAFDLDGTLGCARGLLRGALAAHLGVDAATIHEGGPYTQYGFTTHDATQDAEIREVADTLWERAAPDAALLPGAKDVVWRAAWQGRLLGYVTRRPAHLYDLTHAWIARMDLPRDTLFCTPPALCKSEIVRRLGCVPHLALVEDSPSEALRAAGNGLRVLLLDRPYNQGAAHPLITRVPDLHAALTFKEPT